MEIIMGKNSVMEALKAGRPISKILFSQSIKQGNIKEITNIAQIKNIPYQFVDKKKLDVLAEGNIHQGIIAETGVKEYVDWEEIVDNVQEKGEEPFLIILDGLEDPHNLGAIMRTADAVGAHGIIIPKHRSVSLTSGVARASAGAIEYIPVARVTNLPKTMDKLKEKGCWIVGTDVEGKQKYFEANLKGPLVIVLGSEGRGLGKLVKEKCDFLVSIPMVGHVNSLNVSAAGAVLLYEIIRQRNLCDS
ncbi:MAG: 23S rRNA (guanosine(2251)-2'-O)-methyltransferase RlmB [Clostridia bacterium]|nr:23S rRNA (guanosine(2251)-2'-O)-methyltransferase RlmB [Clostridia bacterium]